MMGQYILVNQIPVPCDDCLNWAIWLEASDRTVAKGWIGDVEVSTVFLGLTYQMSADGPLLFETMIFGGEFDQQIRRCATWAQAEEQHKEAVAQVRRSQKAIEPGGSDEASDEVIELFLDRVAAALPLLSCDGRRNLLYRLNEKMGLPIFTADVINRVVETGQLD